MKELERRGIRLLLVSSVLGLVLAAHAPAQAAVGQPPVVMVVSPVDGSVYTAGDAVTFVGTAHDAEDGDLTSSLTWTSDLDGPIGSGGSFTTPMLSVGTHFVTASVTDSSGLNGSQTVAVTVDAPAPVELSFLSIGSEDGDVAESPPGSGVGGIANAGGQDIHVGDHFTDAQLKGVVSFDTSAIPDDAVIQSATLRLRRETVWGTNPFDVLGPCWIDVQRTAFGGNVALQPGDFQAAPTVARAGTLANATRNGDWSTGTLSAAGLRAINKSGRTQLRVAFAQKTDGNGAIDRILYSSGDQLDPAVRPQLVVTYVRGAPTVTIAAPGDGAVFLSGFPALFQGSAADARDGDLTSHLVWTSDLDGPIGRGGAFAVSSLSVGLHTITAEVIDSDGFGGFQTLQVSVTSPPSSAVQLSFRSIAAEDGDLVESSPTSGVGGFADANDQTLQVGDHLTDGQVKGLVSFDTSAIPDDATVVSATLRMRRSGVWGGNPFDTLGPCWIDVQTGAFGGNPALEPSDFQAVPTAVAVGTLGNAIQTGDWSTGTLSAAGLMAINPTGLTQMRLAFEVHDNANASVDRILYGAGEQNDPALRPELIVTYVLPSASDPTSSTTTTTEATTSSTTTSSTITTSTTSSTTTSTTEATTSSTTTSSTATTSTTSTEAPSTTTSTTEATTSSTTTSSTTTTSTTSTEAPTTSTSTTEETSSSTTTSTTEETTSSTTSSTSSSSTTTSTTAAPGSSTSTTSSSTSTSSTSPPVQVSFRSVGAEDGYVVESSESSGVGGAANANGGQVRAGDYAANRQVKGIVSFDTSSIPDGATVVSATLRLRRQSVRGANPFGVLGRCWIDVQTGGFGGSTALQAADFEASATAARAGTLSNAARRGEWSTGTLGAAGLAAINRTGRTQLRIAFELDDNNNRRQDTIGWTSGDRKPAVRPELVVTYVE